MVLAKFCQAFGNLNVRNLPVTSFVFVFVFSILFISFSLEVLKTQIKKKFFSRFVSVGLREKDTW